MQVGDEELLPEDIPAEAVDDEVLDENISQELIKLREKLKKAVAEKQEYLDGWQRSRADFANYKREEVASQSERDVGIKIELVENLLPALDSFEMAFKHAQSKEFNLLHKQILDALRRMGVEIFGKAGEKFDPYQYEALSEVPAETPDEDDRVVSVERSGYSIGNKIIRPAQVIIKNYNV